MHRGGGNSLKSSHNHTFMAFTLAEVLITLGIIGVVAALTLPTLISNYKKQTYITGLQKAYSVLNNMTKGVMARDGVTDFSETNLMKAWENAYQRNYGSAQYTAFADELKRYFPNAEVLNMASPYNYLPLLYSKHEVGKIDSNYHLLKVGAGIFYMPILCLENQDSIMYCFSLHYNGPQSGYSDDFLTLVNGDQMQFDHVIVDVNGFKKPNQLGRDMFLFSIGYKSGKVVPAASKAINDAAFDKFCYSLSGSNLDSCKKSLDKIYEQATQKNNYCFNTEAQKKPEGVNLYCADKIIREGWKMNY